MFHNVIHPLQSGWIAIPQNLNQRYIPTSRSTMSNLKICRTKDGGSSRTTLHVQRTSRPDGDNQILVAPQRCLGCDPLEAPRWGGRLLSRPRRGLRRLSAERLTLGVTLFWIQRTASLSRVRRVSTTRRTSCCALWRILRAAPSCTPSCMRKRCARWL